MLKRRYRRHTARVLLIDADDRVLLFRHQGDVDSGGRATWITPGGGRSRWESMPRAAARELREETGLRVRPAVLGRPVAYTTGYGDQGWSAGLFRDDYFLHRVTAHTVDTSGFTDHERTHMSVHRWWTVAALAATEERVLPIDLADLLTRLLAGWRPIEPVQLPWEHARPPADPAQPA
jgi:8-oxo-dGTP pyrophosphatase MutT (NUDIX family)